MEFNVLDPLLRLEAESASALEEQEQEQEAERQPRFAFSHLFAGSTTSCADGAKNLTSAARLISEKQQLRDQETTQIGVWEGLDSLCKRRARTRAMIER